MERDSILFYRSFYEAIRGLPKDIQLEIYTAIMEYGLNGNLAENLKPVAKGMFALIKPVLDNNNTRFENGKKGGRKSSVKDPSTKPDPDHTLTFEQEIAMIEADAEWTASVCEDYSLTPKEYADRLKRFLKHCNDSRDSKPHDNLDDAKNHLRYWMDKAYPPRATEATASPSERKPATRRAKTEVQALKESEKRRKAEEQKRAKEFNGMSPAEARKQFLKSKGLDPDSSVADLIDSQGRSPSTSPHPEA